MIITTSGNVPDGTYFNTGDVEPTINADSSLTIYNGDGTRRSWGRPQVTSRVVLDEGDFVAIHIGYSHKHRGGQFWRYYTSDGQATRQITWPQMPDEQRQAVLDAYNKPAVPYWIKVPGKLRSERRTVKDSIRTSYKLVAVDGDGRLFSIYDGTTEYVLGKRMAEAVGQRAGVGEYGDVRHAGGFYSHPTPEQVRALWERGALVPNDRIEGITQVALLECEIAGRIVQFPNGKLASTYLTPIAVVDAFAVTKEPVA